MGVPNNGCFIMDKPIGMDDDWGKPYFRKPPYTYIHMLVGGFNPSEKYERQLG